MSSNYEKEGGDWYIMFFVAIAFVATVAWTVWLGGQGLRLAEHLLKMIAKI